MIECLPASLCSWNFVVRGFSSGPATVKYDWFSEQGRIDFGGVEYDIRKHGMFSGRWTLERAAVVVAEAHKPSAMFRAFEIRSESVHLLLKAETPFTRAFHLSMGGRTVGSIRPAHAFTRRATIECSGSIPEHVQLFAFWLVGLSWRRSANSSGSNAS